MTFRDEVAEMPLRGKLVAITYCGECPHSDMQVSSPPSYPYCNAITPNRKFIENAVDDRKSGIPSWCPLQDANVRDAAIASAAVKAFATESQQFYQAKSDVWKHFHSETHALMDELNLSNGDHVYSALYSAYKLGVAHTLAHIRAGGE